MLKKLNKLFLDTKIDFKETIIISIAVGIFCGVFGGLPALSDSSFTDMAGGYEFWVVAAVIICVNSKNFYTAGLKCGLFFLITQPLQFFIQALLYADNLSRVLYYFKVWLPVIILTVPGGMVAYFAKKENIVGASILGLGNTIEAISFISYFNKLINNFPWHLLSTVFSITSIFVMSLVLQKKKMNRIISIGISILIALAILIYAKIKGLYI